MGRIVGNRGGTPRLAHPSTYHPSMWRGLSLANKCLLLFGGALVLIVLSALSVPWLRMNALVDEGQLELSRQLVDAWERLDLVPGPIQAQPGFGSTIENAGDPGGRAARGPGQG